mmetsp:Transcript_96836/g.145033  ORF Transcript_96836/g.145033 Transcript_96836/m.145033 type:complete len:388 (+) Transcript_96836:649-1812(+)
MPGLARRLVVRNVPHRVAASRVLRPAPVLVVAVARLVHHHVLQDRVLADRSVDQRLLHRVQVDHLGIAPALQVEHTVLVPSVLVVPDQEPRCVSRQRRLAGPAQPEEDRSVPGRAHRRRAVHRHDALQREHVVHHRERSLLHLPRVLSPRHHSKPTVHVHRHARLRPESLLLPLLEDRLAVDDRDVRLELRKLLRRRADEHVGAEVVVPRQLRHHTHRAPRLLARAHKPVEHVHLLKAPQALGAAVEHLVERRLLDRDVYVAPVHVVVGLTGVHDVPVLGAAARELAGVHQHRVVLHDLALAAGQNLVTHVVVRHVPLAPGVLEEVEEGGSVHHLRDGVRLAELQSRLHDIVTGHMASSELHREVGLALLISGGARAGSSVRCREHG